MLTHPYCCRKQGHTAWLQVNFVALVSCAHFFFIVNSDACKLVVLQCQYRYYRYSINIENIDIENEYRNNIDILEKIFSVKNHQELLFETFSDMRHTFS